jgi:hypothetical protein
MRPRTEGANGRGTHTQTPTPNDDVISAFHAGGGGAGGGVAAAATQPFDRASSRSFLVAFDDSAAPGVAIVANADSIPESSVCNY